MNLKIKASDKLSKKDKDQLIKIQSNLLQIISDYRIKYNSRNPDIDYVKSKLFSDTISSNSVIDNYIEFKNYVRQHSKNIKKQSFVQFDYFEENIKDFFSKEKILDEKNYFNFINYLESKDKNYSVGTLKSKMSYFRRFCTFAVKNKYADFEIPKTNTYKSYSYQNKNVETLRKEELKFLISKLDDKTLLKRHLTVLSLFLFQCFTSLRYSDLIQITPKFKGNKTIKLISKKTGSEIFIYLDDFLIRLLELNDYNLNIYSNTHYNLILQQIFTIFAETQKSLKETVDVTEQTVSGLYSEFTPKTNKFERYKLFSSHSGRRTFITMQIEMNTPFPDIMTMTGHKNFDILKEYLDIYNKQKAGEKNMISNKMYKIITGKRIKI